MAAPLPRQIHLTDVPGWHRVDYAPRAWWEPRSTGAEHRLLGRYADDKGHEADLFLAVYASQREGKEAGGFGEGALTPDSGWAWQAHGPEAPGGKSDRLLGPGRVERLAETYYRSGALLTGSNARLKLANMRDRLLLRSRPTMLLILSVEERPGKPARASLEAFRRSTGPLGPWMDRMAAVR
jgi:EpsI family protein